MSNPIVHLIAGSTGAGKTTYARRLCADIGALHFSIDQWMAILYWPDASDPIDPNWAMQRVERCTTQIWSMAAQAAALGTPSVLDLGFTNFAQRKRIADLARDAGLSVQLHVLDIPADIRWARVQGREQSPADEHRLPFTITREMFDYVETLWEPPTPAEMAALNGLRITQ